MVDNKTAQSLTLGGYLLAARQEAGLGRRGLAELSGVGRMTIQRLETDYYQTEPSADDLMHLARALELNATDLFLLAGIPLPKQAASLEVMLRTGYGVEAADIPDLKRRIESLIAEHAGPAVSRETNKTQQIKPNQAAEGGDDHDQPN